jgi:hypothetical protein
MNRVREEGPPYLHATLKLQQGCCVCCDVCGFLDVYIREICTKIKRDYILFFYENYFKRIPTSCFSLSQLHAVFVENLIVILLIKIF